MWIRIAYGIAAVSLVAFVEFAVGWSIVLEPWTRAAPSAILVALVLVLATYVIRSARLFRYFHECHGISPCIRLFLVHNLLVNVLPLHGGDVSFPMLMKRYFSISLNRSVPGLLWLRYLDFHTLLLIALVALWLATDWAWVPPTAIAWVVLPVLTVLCWEASCRILERHDNQLSTTVLDALQTLPRSRTALLESWGWTALNWGFKITAFAWILTIFSPIGFVESLLGATGGELSSILPLKMPASIGTYEAGVTAATTPLGVRFEHALAAGVNLHLFVLGVAIVSGLMTFLIPRYAGARDSAAA